MITVTGEQNIMNFKNRTLLAGLKLEALHGMRLSRNSSCYAIVKKQFSLKGNKLKVYEQFKNLLDN